MARSYRQSGQCYEKQIDIKINITKSEEERKNLQKQRSQYTPSKFWDEMSNNEINKHLFLMCMYLLELSIMFPLSVSCVERLFHVMKLVKTRLRNQLGQTTLESLLRISTEAKETFLDEEYEFFVDELKRLNPKLRMDICFLFILLVFVKLDNHTK